jgi:hypothetical protein
MMPYVNNPFLLPIRLGLGPRPLANAQPGNPARQNTSPAPQGANLTYDENKFRLPIGVTIFWIVVFFASIALYTM